MSNCISTKEPPYAERHVRWCERGRKTKVGRKLLRFPPTRLDCFLFMKELIYKDFFNTDFVLELRKGEINTENLIQFVNSLVGVKNFMKHHPVPVINYYWEKSLGYSKFIESLAQEMKIPLKHIKRPDEYTQEEVMLCCKWDGNGADDYGGIDAVRGKIGKASQLMLQIKIIFSTNPKK